MKFLPFIIGLVLSVPLFAQGGNTTDNSALIKEVKAQGLGSAQSYRTPPKPRPRPIIIQTGGFGFYPSYPGQNTPISGTVFSNVRARTGPTRAPPPRTAPEGCTLPALMEKAQLPPVYAKGIGVLEQMLNAPLSDSLWTEEQRSELHLRRELLSGRIRAAAIDGLSSSQEKACLGAFHQELAVLLFTLPDSVLQGKDGSLSRRLCKRKVVSDNRLFAPLDKGSLYQSGKLFDDLEKIFKPATAETERSRLLSLYFRSQP